MMYLYQGKVQLFNGKYWIPQINVEVTASAPHVAITRAFSEAKKRVKRGAHIEEFRIALRRVRKTEPGLVIREATCA